MQMRLLWPPDQVYLCLRVSSRTHKCGVVKVDLHVVWVLQYREISRFSARGSACESPQEKSSSIRWCLEKSSRWFESESTEQSLIINSDTTSHEAYPLPSFPISTVALPPPPKSSSYSSPHNAVSVSLVYWCRNLERIFQILFGKTICQIRVTYSIWRSLG